MSEKRQACQRSTETSGCAGTLREIHLAFYSLIRIFKDVEVHKKSMVWNTTPRLPSGFTAGTQQVLAWPALPARS